MRFQARHDALRTAARAAGFDVLAAIPGANLIYHTGLSFHLGGRPVVAFFPVDDEPSLLLPELEEEKRKSGALKFRHVFTYTDGAGPGDAFAAAAKRLGLSTCRVGVEGKRMRLFETRLLGAARAIESADAAFLAPRLRKDASELAALRRAVEIVECALAETVRRVRAGVAEEELVREMAVQLLRAGSEPAFPFQPFAATGENGALPHAISGERELQPGHLLTLDLGASAENYFSDITRTFAVGGAAVAPELLRAYDAVKRANEAGRAAVRPGVTGEMVDRAARAVIERAGFANYFIHRTGHGLGLEAHEEPEIKEGARIPLEPEMVFTIEPGVYIPGLGGVRIEDDVVVTPTGGESLTTYDRALTTLG